MFWGVIIILIGLVILFEVVIKDMAKQYTWLSWVNTVQWNWIFAFVIAIFIIIFGLRVSLETLNRVREHFAGFNTIPTEGSMMRFRELYPGIKPKETEKY